MSDLPADAYLPRAAQECYALMYEDTPYQPTARPLTDFGPFATVVGELRDLHQQAITLSMSNGKIYDVWADCRTAWEGLRLSDDGSKQYGLLDEAVRRIAYALDDGRPAVMPANSTKPSAPALDYAPTPTPPVDVNDLLDMERKPTIWYAPSFLREGLGLLVGQPNVGKTPAAIQLMIALATGGKWFNTVLCRRSKVLYLGMEYSSQELIPMFDISRMGMEIPRSQLLVKTIEDDFPTSAEAALDELEWYLRVIEVRVICIDVLTAFLPPEKFKQNVYRGDYSELKPYHRLALKYNASILGIWHASKRESDPRIMYNGSTGMWAAAASRITMYQDQEQRVRIASFPRMGDRIDWALTQEKTQQGRRWVVADAAPEPMMSPSELQVYRFLKEHASKTKPLSPATIAELTGMVPSSVRTHVVRMFEQNVLQRIGNGYYIDLVAPVAVETIVAPVAPVAPSEVLQTPEKVLQTFDAPRAGKSEVLQLLHVSSDRETIVANSATNPVQEDTNPVQASDLIAMLKVRKDNILPYFNSNNEADQERARAWCKDYGLDYEDFKRKVNA